MSKVTRTDSGDLEVFAAAVAHEIRTPLSAVAGEVEVALRRQRSAAEYREALERIAAGVAELVEISGDLTLLSDPPGHAGQSRPASLDAILSSLRTRYHGRDEVSIDARLPAGVRVAGNEPRLARAVVLIIEHALRYRQGNATVRLRAEVMATRRVRLIVEAPPFGFWPRAWHWLAESPRTAAGPLRLRTALRIVEGSGGALVADSASEMERVHIELQPAS